MPPFGAGDAAGLAPRLCDHFDFHLHSAVGGAAPKWDHGSHVIRFTTIRASQHGNPIITTHGTSRMISAVATPETDALSRRGCTADRQLRRTPGDDAVNPRIFLSSPDVTKAEEDAVVRAIWSGGSPLDFSGPPHARPLKGEHQAPLRRGMNRYGCQFEGH